MMIKYSMEHLFSYTATIGAPQMIGAAVHGLRANFDVTGGTVVGPRLNGTILPVGGDWLLMRPDGVVEIDVRITIRTDDDVLINMSYTGNADMGLDGFQQFASGQAPALGTPLRTFPKFQTGSEKYAWLNRLAMVGIGEAHVNFAGQSKLLFDVYAVK
jgi:Protein of unknown function (DUF3237)